MQDEKLIECVRRREFLYNLSHRMYKDNKYKTAAWSEIGVELNQTGAQCKTRWYNIRDQFRKYRGKINSTRSGQAALRMKKYKYADLLDFLVPFLQERNTISSFPQDDGDNGDNGDNGDSPGIETPQASTLEEEFVSPACSQPAQAQRSRVDQEEQIRIVDEAIQDCRRIIDSSTGGGSSDHLNGLFAGVRERLRRLSKPLQAEGEIALISLITYLEMKEAALNTAENTTQNALQNAVQMTAPNAVQMMAQNAAQMATEIAAQITTQITAQIAAQLTALSGDK